MPRRFERSSYVAWRKTRLGFVAANAFALGQLPAGLTPGKDFSFDSIADDELLIGDLICSSQAAKVCLHW